MRRALWQVVPLAVFALLVGIQLFGPHPIGKSDNGDFPKVLGHIGVWVAPEFRDQLFSFYVTGYQIDDSHTWDPRTPTTEVWIARLAKVVCEAVLPTGRFDIRVLGALHAMLACLAFWLCLIPLAEWRWPWRLTFTVILLAVFADPQYVEFFSSAYMDTASLVFLMLVFGAAWNVAHGNAGVKWLVPFCILGCLFLGTKLQHQACVIPLGLFACVVAYRSRQWIWLAVPMAFAATTCFMFSQTYTGYRAEPLFSAVYFKILPMADDPEGKLRELGRPATDLAYVRMHAYSQGSPLTDAAYRASFEHDVTAGSVLRLYARHPSLAMQVLRSDFLAFAADVPISSFGTMRRIDNPVPLFRMGGPQPWSALRRGLAILWPWHIPFLYLIVPFWIESRLQPLALMVAAIGVLSFAAGSLLDATETSRHIILYQEATDLVYVLAIYCVAKVRRPG